MSDAERLIEAFKNHEPLFVLRAMDQFAIQPKQNCGLNGWYWRLSDGTSVVLSDGLLLPLHNVRSLR